MLLLEDVSISIELDQAVTVSPGQFAILQKLAQNTNCNIRSAAFAECAAATTLLFDACDWSAPSQQC